MKSNLQVAKLLHTADLRRTRQRTHLASILFQDSDRHITAEQLYVEASKAGHTISLATVYNTLHQFRAAGLLRQVIVEPGKVYFDTNTEPHHHFYLEENGELLDVDSKEVKISSLPKIPVGYDLHQMDVIIRLRKKHLSRNKI